MVDISRKRYGRNGIETIIDNDGILWLNDKHLEEGLDHKNLLEISAKCHSDHSVIQMSHRHELDNKSENQYNRNFIDIKLDTRVIMDCRTTSAHKFRTRLGFKQYDIILTKEQSVLTKIMSPFKEENMQTQYNVLGYKIDLYFRDYNLMLQ